VPAERGTSEQCSVDNEDQPDVAEEQALKSGFLAVRVWPQRIAPNYAEVHGYWGYEGHDRPHN
jgi:hypothetical protein